MNRFDSEENGEAIYDYYEKHKKSNISTIIIFCIIIGITFIISSIEDLSFESILQKNDTVITDDFQTIDSSSENFTDNYTQPNLYINNADLYNSQFEKYFGKNISGTEVKALLRKIQENNILNPDYEIGIDPNFTSVNGEKITGQNNSPDIFPSLIDDNRTYIVCVTDISIAYHSNGYIARISIDDPSTKSDSEIFEFNTQFTKYFSDIISGKDVKKLLSIIDASNNIEVDNKVKILFHVSGISTTSGSSFYELSGISTNMNTYSTEIIDNNYYFVDVHETNPDGTICSIVISDDIYKYNYYY